MRSISMSVSARVSQHRLMPCLHWTPLPAKHKIKYTLMEVPELTKIVR